LRLERDQAPVDVGAETLYEAAILALRFFPERDCTPGPITELAIKVRSPAVTHTITVRKVEDWLNGSARNPREAVDRGRLRELLGPRRKSRR